MIAQIERDSDRHAVPIYKEFNTLQELLSFRQSCGYGLIISGPSEWKEDKPHDFCIEIYDDE